MGSDGPEAWPADRAQVCAQGLIQRDNGYTCDEATSDAARIAGAFAPDFNCDGEVRPARGVSPASIVARFR